MAGAILNPIMSNWQFQDAKARLSEVVKNATEEGPQRITLPGAPAVVVLSEKDYQRLTERPKSFIDFVRRSPLKGLKLESTRHRGPPRDVRL